jgi:3-oxoacyl-[acyl-carrier protein] reductase
MRKTILVTGSSRGLGATIAKTLAAQGHNVIINYVQNKTLAKQLVNEIGNDLALAIQADITDRAQVDQLIATASTHFGKIDAVVNNALVGFKFDPTSQKSFKDLSWTDYQQQIDGTLKGAFNVTQAVVIQQFISKQIRNHPINWNKSYIKTRSSPIMNTRQPKQA